MLVFMVGLGLLYLVLPLVCWAFLVRTRPVGVAVFAVLTGLAVALLGLEQERYFLRAAAEIESGYPIAAGLVLLAGGLAERRLRGPRPAREFLDPVSGSVVAVTTHLLAGIGIAIAYQMLSFGSFLPSAAEVSPPAGLTVTHSTDGYCGSNFCSRTLTIGTTGGLPAADVEARMRAALTADGWTPGPDGALLRPHGWLLDRRVSEAFVSGTTVELSGSESVDARP
ncbi:hypothetical protein ACIRVF_19650 [Kitasatospora sp. NPDC101157]|uniref:hypothetical protein n=1 Tax=Kitasatospora sp. NPDC101157 TaxID=3364098 RepID=UPI0038004D87